MARLTRRTLLASDDVAEPMIGGEHGVSREDVAWLEDAMGGVDLAAPKVVYDVFQDTTHSARGFLRDTHDALYGTRGEKMLVVVARLSTGRVVVGATAAGWGATRGENGGVSDASAALYSVGVGAPNRKFPVGDPRRALWVQNGPSTYYGASFGYLGKAVQVVDIRLTLG